MTRKWLWAVVAVAGLLPASTAAAQEWRIEWMPEGTTYPEHLRSPMGTSVQIGGGVADFTDSEVSGLSGAAGSWAARAVFGTRSAIAGEVGYLGAASEIDALGLDSDTALVRNGLEANLRINVPIVSGPWMLQPYAFGGLGWTRFDLVNEGRNTSSVRSNDDVFHIPFGGGFAMSFNQLVIDARYAFYPAFDDELLRTPTGSTDEDANLDHWVVNLTVGYEI